MAPEPDSIIVPLGRSGTPESPPDEMIDFGPVFAIHHFAYVPPRSIEPPPRHGVEGRPHFPQSHPISDPMQTKLPEINASELKAVRDFLIGATDEVRFPTPNKTTRPASNARAAVPVSNGISRARMRSAKTAH